MDPWRKSLADLAVVQMVGGSKWWGMSNQKFGGKIIIKNLEMKLYVQENDGNAEKNQNKNKLKLTNKTANMKSEISHHLLDFEVSGLATVWIRWKNQIE